MPASFPSSIKSFTTKTDGVDDVEASHINDLQLEVAAIETELGINPTLRLASYNVGSAKTIATSTTTIVDFDTVNFDPRSLVTTGAAWKFTGGATGYYQINATVTFSSVAWAAGDYILLYLYRGGGLRQWLNKITIFANISQEITISGSSMDYLPNSSAYFDVRIWHNRGSDTDISSTATKSSISIARIL